MSSRRVTTSGIRRGIRARLLPATIAALLLHAVAYRTAAQENASRAPIRATVTYVSGDVFYITPGSGAGVADSAEVIALSGRDTVATLKVFAVSTKSAACRIVSSRRRPRAGDAAIVVNVPPPPAPSPAVAAADSARGDRRADFARAVAPDGRLQPSPTTDGSGLRLRGRISAQYQTFLLDSSFAAVTRPGLSVFLRGDAPGSPIRFEISGALRSTVTGTSGPFAAKSMGSSRIYRAFVEYNDSLNRFGIGRLFPSPGLPSGYLDGFFAARRFGVLEVGAGAGFEPDSRQEKVLPDMRKILAFLAASSVEPFTWSASAGFSKTFQQSAPERSVLSASAFAVPSGIFSFTGHAEVDFLSVRNGAAISRPKLTSLHAAAHLRPVSAVTVGAGVTGWRPVYPLSSAAAIPDSMRDNRLQVSPSLSISLHPGGGFSIQESYAPRTSDDGFAREYSNIVSLSLDNAAGTGVGLRATQSLNKSSFARSTGVGGSVSRSFAGTADVGLRYQYYRHDFESAGEDLRTDAVGIDAGAAFTGSLYLMLGVELSFAESGDYRLYTGSLSWRF